MNENEMAKAGYDAALRLADKDARSIWTFFAGMIAINTILITLTAATHSPLLQLSAKVPGLPAMMSVLGISACAIWAVLTARTRAFYAYYMACARAYEEKAFGENVRLVRDGRVLSKPEGEVFVAGERQHLGNFGTLITAEWLIYFVILIFGGIHAYVGLIVF